MKCVKLLCTVSLKYLCICVFKEAAFGGALSKPLELSVSKTLSSIIPDPLNTADLLS